MTTGTATRSFGLSALVILATASISLLGMTSAHADGTMATNAAGGVTFTTGATTVNSTSSIGVYYSATALNPNSPISYTNYIGTAVPDVNGTGPGYSGSTYPNGATAYYVSPSGANASTPGYFDYRVSFNLLSPTSTVNFGGYALGDNEIQGVYVDGTSMTFVDSSNTGGTGNNPSSATYKFNGLSAGYHTFDIIDYNNSGPTNVAFLTGFTGGTPTATTPEPGVFVTAASMLSMTGLGMVRGRRRAKGVKTAA